MHWKREEKRWWLKPLWKMFCFIFVSVLSDSTPGDINKVFVLVPVFYTVSQVNLCNVVCPSMNVMWCVLWWILCGVSFVSLEGMLCNVSFEECCVMWPSMNVMWCVLWRMLCGVFFDECCVVCPLVNVMWFVL